MASERPIQVRRAVALLWTSLALTIVLAITVWEPFPEDLKEYEALTYAAIGIGYAISAALIYLASRQRNWARVILLLFTVVGVAAYLAPWGDDPIEPLWSKVSTIFLTVLDVIAMYWLFSKPASQWFKSRKVRPSAV
jgi:hypothetical protein